MNWLSLILGVLILASAIIDLVWTTLWAEGNAGPVTSRLMMWTWYVVRKTGNHHSRILSLAGPIILSLTLTMWIALTWGGWTLIFGSTENALIDTLSNRPISWSDRIYFTGYALFTLGNGDLAPRDGVWQIATTLITANGMLLLTMGATYILSVLDAVSQKRSFATNVTGLGMRGEAVVRVGWNGENFQDLNLPFNTLTSQLTTLTANHKAYPVLHYFHSTEVDQDPVIGVAVLDEALTILRLGTAKRDGLNRAIVKNARSSVQSYLETLDALSTMSQPADRTPPLPNLGSLRDADIQTVSDEEFANSLSTVDERRRRLLGLVESSARQWPSQEE